ncbi:MAG: PKD domain-containing protein [Phycisphaerales bacterium]|nr:PKD domain-containing protein [Phycisphaerales bacterium]
MLRCYCLLLIILLAFVDSYGQEGSSIDFVQNKGQWNKEVLFKGDMLHGAFFVHLNGYTVSLNNPKEESEILTDVHTDSSTYTNGVPNGSVQVLHAHAYRVVFMNAQATPLVQPEKLVSSGNNYIEGNNPALWARDCSIYKSIAVKNIYSDIDLRYFTNNGLLKYELIVNPGANLAPLALLFKGTTAINLAGDGDLIIHTSVGDVVEKKPYCYQPTLTGRREVGCRYVITDDSIVSFALDNYDKNFPLIIDPTLVFSTLSGSSATNWGFSATYDNQGYLYAAGIAYGNGFPTSPGAFQTTFRGGTVENGVSGYDMVVIKYSPNGQNRIYATYIGGGGNEQPHSLIVTPAGNLVIAGRTSSPDYPTTLSNIGSCNGGYAIVLTILNAQGTGLIASRKIGGSGVDGVNGGFSKAPYNVSRPTVRNYGDDARSEVILDKLGNIYLASCTQSNNFPTTANAPQKVLNGKQNGVILKFDQNLNLAFSTYLGGSGNDACFVLSLNPLTQDILIGGATSSSDFPGDKTGTVGPVYNGGVCNGFLAVLSNDGGILKKTSYIGAANAATVVYGVQYDATGNPYICGTTTKSFPVINAPFSQPNGKQFIAKLAPDLSQYVYSTVFGTNTSNPNISITAFLVDRCENVYVGGWGGSVQGISPDFPNDGTLGLSVTQDAIQKKTDGKDFYFFVLERDARSQLYGTYFGQYGGFTDHVDGGTSRFDPRGVIYEAICANCGGGVLFPTTPGAWYTAYDKNAAGNMGCNLGAVKIEMGFIGITSEIHATINNILNKTTGCQPLIVNFSDAIAQATMYVWRYGDGTKNDTTLEPYAQHTFTNLGNYIVTLFSINPAACNQVDSSNVLIRVKPYPVALDFTFNRLLPCDVFNYQFVNKSEAPIGKPFTNETFSWNFGDGTAPITTNTESISYSFVNPGTYTVQLSLIDTDYCNYPDSIQQILNVSATLKAVAIYPQTACYQTPIIFKNASIGGTNFNWSFGDGTASSAFEPIHSYQQPGTYLVKLVVTDVVCNLKDSTQSYLAVGGQPTVNFDFTPDKNAQEVNAIPTFNNLSSSDANKFIWYWGTGDSTIVRNKAPVTYEYLSSGIYNVCLVGFNNYCSDTVCQPYSALIQDVVDVASALVPNGVNKKVFVRGAGIQSIDWRIFNRYGRLVYASTDKEMGWDGTYRGVLQPQDVYHYTLNIQFVNGNKLIKKGTITILY